MNDLINTVKELHAKECRQKGKNKTLPSTSFGFQQIICQSLVVKQSTGGGEGEGREWIKCTSKRLQWEINTGGK